MHCVPICEGHDDMHKLNTLYADEIKKSSKAFEFVFVLNDRFTEACRYLLVLRNQGHSKKIIKFAKNVSESATLTEGFRQTRKDTILTLMAYV